MDRLALVSDGFLCVDGGQTDLSLHSVRNRRWRNSNPAGTALKKLFINGKQSSSQNFYPPISSEKKNKMVFSQFFLLSNLKQWVQFYCNWKSGINKEITILCISTKAGSQNITTPEMRDGSMKTDLQQCYDACEQCWSWFVIIYTSMSPALAACSRKLMAVFSSSALCCPLLDRSSFAWRYCACLWPPTAACQ